MPKAPGPFEVQSIDPVGTCGLALVSVIVTVQLTVLKTITEVGHGEIVVWYERKAVQDVPQGIGVGCSVCCMPVK